MKICFIAYADSIHTKRWIKYFCNNPKNQIHLITFIRPQKPIENVTIHSLGGQLPNRLPSKDKIPDKLIPKAKTALNKLYANPLLNSLLYSFQQSHWSFFLPFRALSCKNKVKKIIANLQPDIVHCLSIQFGGCLGGLIGYHPLIISTWGTDFVYFAKYYKIYYWLTRKAFSETDLFFPDNIRDKYLAEVYGFSPSKPSWVVPATGGLELQEFPLYSKNTSIREKLKIDPNTNLLICIRGFKTFHTNTEVLIKAIPQIVAKYPDSLFVIDGPYLSPSYSPLIKLAKDLNIEKYICFTNKLNRQDLADYLSASDIMVSVTIYDGLPISMLEGIAYGTIPIMSNHSSMHDWITDTYNGYFIDPKDPKNIAQVVVKALENKDKFEGMRKRNWDLLRERANYHKNMKIVEEMYNKLIKKSIK